MPFERAVQLLGNLLQYMFAQCYTPTEFLPDQDGAPGDEKLGGVGDRPSRTREGSRNSGFQVLMLILHKL